MANEQFRDCFVGEKGYGSLKQVMKTGNEFCTDIAKYWQDRYETEMTYVRSLRKNNEALQKIVSKSKGSIAQSFHTVAQQTDAECEAHIALADTLLKKISIPMKTLAETQLKARKSIEDSLNSKFKAWKEQKDVDNKYRCRQFDKSKDIETLYLRMDEIPKTTKNSVKETSKIEMSLRKCEQELDKIEQRYRTATRDVELARQACDAEMCKSCDQMQAMELERIVEMAKYIRIYSDSIQSLSTTMNKVTQELLDVRVSAEDDVVAEAKLNLQAAESEILLYDIYAENEHHPMSLERRVLSLMNWMQKLRQDIEIQRRSKSAGSFVPPPKPSAPRIKSKGGNSPDDDQSSSSDGAMCSTSSRSAAENASDEQQNRDGSSSPSEDEDGAFHHHRKEKKHRKKKKEGTPAAGYFLCCSYFAPVTSMLGHTMASIPYTDLRKNQKFSTSVNSSEIYINRESVRLLTCLYEASLYKIEKIYNHIKHLTEPAYEHSQRLARSFNDKGVPTTFLRLPFQPLTLTPPSAPTTTMLLATQSVPIFPAMPMPQLPAHAPKTYSAHRQTPEIGFAGLNTIHPEHSAPDDTDRYRTAPVSAYPVLPSQMTTSTDSTRLQRSAKQVELVKVMHDYDAVHDDELTIRQGDIITMIERRTDQWFKGNLNNKIGLFPGNFVQEL